MKKLLGLLTMLYIFTITAYADSGKAFTFQSFIIFNIGIVIILLVIYRNIKKK